MYFASIREGGMGAYDLYVSRFENGEWCKAICLPAPINTKRDEFDPFVTLDGSKLFFASNRHNSDKYWNCDIFVSEWDGEKWGKPGIYDSTFVTPGKPDWGVAVPKDFQKFIFSSGREPAKPRLVQIFQSIWLGDKWSVPSPFPPPVNSGGWEATPYITPDGKTLFLNSGRGDKDKKDVDIWTFENVNGRWTHPRLMKGPFLSDKHDYDPCLSPDGKKFYFTSNREGGFGGCDIYVVEKIDYCGYKILSAKTLLQKINRGEIPILIDCRPEDEYRAGHLPGAVNVSMDSYGFGKKTLIKVAMEKIIKQTGRQIHFVLIDTATGEEYMPRKKLLELLKYLPDDRDKKVIVYCRQPACTRSPMAARWIVTLGYKNVFRYAGGWKEWKEKKYPVEK
jgi:rhodanese-related sulfurtransferase